MERKCQKKVHKWYINVLVAETVTLEIKWDWTALRTLNGFLRKNRNTSDVCLCVCVFIHLQTQKEYVKKQFSYLPHIKTALKADVHYFACKGVEENGLI